MRKILQLLNSQSIFWSISIGVENQIVTLAELFNLVSHNFF